MQAASVGSCQNVVELIIYILGSQRHMFGCVMTSSESVPKGMVDPAIFEYLQTKLDEDAQVREELRNIVQSMERRDRITTSILSRAHSLPQAYRQSSFGILQRCLDITLHIVQRMLEEARESIDVQVENIAKLNDLASKHPYYKYNNMWSREMQNAVSDLALITVKTS